MCLTFKRLSIRQLIMPQALALPLNSAAATSHQPSAGVSIYYSLYFQKHFSKCLHTYTIHL